MNGRTYTATSRMASANDIARQLVADDVPDAPMHVYTLGLKGCLFWRSFYKAAGYTFRESATKPVHQTRWVDPASVMAQISATTEVKQGLKAPPRGRVAPESSPPQNANTPPAAVDVVLTSLTRAGLAPALIPLDPI